MHYVTLDLGFTLNHVKHTDDPIIMTKITYNEKFS